MTRLHVDALRRDLEAFGFEVAHEEYLNAIGLKDDVDVAPIYDRYAHVHSREALTAVRRACSAAAADEARRLRHLEMDVLGAVVSEPFAEEEDALATEETQAVVVVDGETVTYRSVGTRVRDEDDRALRRRFVEAERDVSLRFLPRVESLERRYRKAFTGLGYGNDAERWETEYGLSLEEIERTMRPALDESTGPYVRALGERLERVESLSLADVERHDVAHMMRAKAFDAFFPKEQVVPALHRFLGGLGFDVARLPNVTLDLEDRPNKDPRAFVLPARVPDDVRLVVRPEGGVDDYRALFHEAGHLLHFALTRKDLPYEDRYLGESGVTESYAFLFEHLLENPLFLADVAPSLDGERLRDYLRYSALDKMLSLRYYVAALSYDRWLASHDLGDAPATYARDLTAALRIPQDPIEYLGTDGFYGVWYLRAWLFEAEHRRYLEREFGERWWREPRAGDHLHRLYARGSAPTIEDLAREIGRERLTARALLDDVRRLAEA